MEESKPTLVVLAAGIGSRYGGLKQAEGFGPSGETLLEYSLYDALRAGFGKVVLVVRRAIEAEVRERILPRLGAGVEVVLAFQEVADLPAGFAPPPGREKPWGTGHAVLAARGLVSEPFAVINADDFYGRAAYALLADRLRRARDARPARYAMVAYRLRNTLSAHGSVARGICSLDAGGNLTSLVERTRIFHTPSGPVHRGGDGAEIPLDPDGPASMNFFGFTPCFFEALGAAFVRFLEGRLGEAGSEFYLTDALGEMIGAGEASVRVEVTDEVWFGVTHPEDRGRTEEAIAARVAAGDYPSPLW